MLQIMKCGNCGCDTAKLEGTRTHHEESFEQIDIICTQCGSRTELRVTAPSIEAHWGRGAEGRFCVGWKE